jgi:hypothetical protein
VLLAAAPAAQLTPSGMGSVRIGMAPGQVEVALGAKLAIEYPNDPSCVEGGRADRKDQHIWYLFENGRLASVEIGEGRTVNGVGIGDTDRAVRKAFPKIVAERHQYDDEGEYLKVKASGKSGIVFETHKGLVTVIRAGKYPAVEYVEGCL